MHDYNGTLHAAADLMAFTSQASGRLDQSILPHAMRAQESAAPAHCLPQDGLSPHFLPLDLNVKHPIAQDRSNVQGRGSALQPPGASHMSDPSSPGPSHPKHSLEQLEAPQQAVAANQAVSGALPEGLPAVERYSRMIATVLQPAQQSQPCSPTRKRLAEEAGMSGRPPVSSGPTTSSSSHVAGSTVMSVSANLQQPVPHQDSSPVKRQRSIKADTMPGQPSHLSWASSVSACRQSNLALPGNAEAFDWTFIAHKQSLQIYTYLNGIRKWCIFKQYICMRLKLCIYTHPVQPSVCIIEGIHCGAQRRQETLAD